MLRPDTNSLVWLSTAFISAAETFCSFHSTFLSVNFSCYLCDVSQKETFVGYKSTKKDIVDHIFKDLSKVIATKPKYQTIQNQTQAIKPRFKQKVFFLNGSFCEFGNSSNRKKTRNTNRPKKKIQAFECNIQTKLFFY